MKELGGKAGPWRVEELKQGSDPHIGVTVWVRGETFKAESEAADLWQPKWNENRRGRPRPRKGRKGKR